MDGEGASSSYGSFSRRLAAYLLDGAIGGLVIAAPTNLLLYGVGAIDRSKPPNHQIDVVPFEIIVTTAVILGLLLFVFMEGSRLQGTPGKLLLGLKVEDASRGGPIGFWRALLRLIVLGPSIWLFGLGVLPIATHPRHQGWHDRAARDVVVRRAG
jgi:uncharacterized RDD family membrane protein YckC